MEGDGRETRISFKLLLFPTTHISPKAVKHKVINEGKTKFQGVTRECRKKNKIYISEHYPAINIYKVYLQIRNKCNYYSKNTNRKFTKLRNNIKYVPFLFSK